MTDKKNGNDVLVASFHDPNDAHTVVKCLHEAGFTDKEIGVLSHDANHNLRVEPLEHALGNKLGPGIGLGVAVGIGLGLVAGVLPGLGPVVAGGLLASALAGAATGGLIGALVGLGLGEDDAEYFQNRFRQGHTIVLVVTGERTDLAFRVFHRYQAAFPPEPSLRRQSRALDESAARAR